MPYEDDPYFKKLLHDCAVRRDESACRHLDLYLAITVIVDRLKVDLGDLLKERIDLPLGPDPVPEIPVLLHGVLDGGRPSRIMPTVGFSSDRTRLELGLQSAMQLKDTLTTVVDELDADIGELKQRVANVSQAKGAK